MTQKQNAYVRWFEDLDSDDVPLVGGKNASLGEMLQVCRVCRVPGQSADRLDVSESG